LPEELNMEPAPKDTNALEQENRRLRREVDELRGYREKYQAVFDHRFNCIYLHDLNGNFLDANDAALKLLGYERADIPNLNFADMIGEDQLPKALEILEEIKRSGHEQKPVEYELERKDGRRIWIETGGSLIYRSGKPWAIVGMARDVTARKQAEAALQKARAELEDRVKVRTAELTAANRRLEQEIARHSRARDALVQSEEPPGRP
jgi:PAS domain S-box-containing protein